jgi:hypothetical protein
MSARSCERIAKLLPAFAGGDLDAATSESVRVHLLGCHACRGDAAVLQRGLGGLRRLGEQPPAGVDEEFFAGMHASIVAACAGEPARAADRRWWRWMLASAAAAALLAIGFWWGHEPADSVWSRPPLGTSAAFEAFEEPKAVPWSGSRVPLRLLGDDDAATQRGSDERLDPGTAPAGTGLGARDRLRSLVDDGMLLPPRRQRK